MTFSTLDFAEGFRQADPKDKHKTAFSSSFGLYSKQTREKRPYETTKEQQGTEKEIETMNDNFETTQNDNIETLRETETEPGNLTNNDFDRPTNEELDSTNLT